MSAARFNTLDAWLSWMESLHAREIDLGLDRTKTVAEKLGILSLDTTVVTVAGTNGKGSFVKALSDLFVEDGTRFGAYTSPHITHYNERICIQGESVSDQALCDAFTEIDRARGATSLTYFEFGTLAALLLFKCAELDVVILEVGLGGRLDAVNIIDPDICVITSIGIDHIDWLGDSRESIGSEKAGILRQARPFICVEAEPPQSVIKRAKELDCVSYYLGNDLSFERLSESAADCCSAESYTPELRLHLQDANGAIACVELTESLLPLPSLLAAAQVYLLLGVPLGLQKTGSVLSSAYLPGRMERCEYDGHQFILDVAHNPQAAKLLARNLTALGHNNLVAVFAAMQDKDVQGMAEMLSSNVSSWVCTQLQGIPRCRAAEALAAELRLIRSTGEFKIGDIETEADSVDAIAKAMSLSLTASTTHSGDPARPILILGSFYLVSEFKSRFMFEEQHI